MSAQLNTIEAVWKATLMPTPLLGGGKETILR
jgi:hypothetical protein